MRRTRSKTTRDFGNETDDLDPLARQRFERGRRLASHEQTFDVGMKSPDLRHDRPDEPVSGVDIGFVIETADEREAGAFGKRRRYGLRCYRPGDDENIRGGHVFRQRLGFDAASA